MTIFLLLQNIRNAGDEFSLEPSWLDPLPVILMSVLGKGEIILTDCVGKLSCPCGLYTIPKL